MIQKKKTEYKDYKYKSEEEKQDFIRKMQERDRDRESESVNSDTIITSTSHHDFDFDFGSPIITYKITGRGISLVGRTANRMGEDAKDILLSAYPDAGKSRYKIIELGIIEGKRKGELGMRLFGEDKRDFEPIKNKDGSFRKSIRKELKSNLGPNADEADEQVIFAEKILKIELKRVF